MKKEIEKMLELSEMVNFNEECNGYWFRSSVGWVKCNRVDLNVFDNFSYCAWVDKGRVKRLVRIKKLSF